MSEWTNLDGARVKFFNAAVRLFRATDADAGFAAVIDPKVLEAWTNYRELLDQRETRELMGAGKPSWHQTLLNFLWFWRSKKDSAAQRRATERVIKRITPPPGSGGPWG